MHDNEESANQASSQFSPPVASLQAGQQLAGPPRSFDVSLNLKLTTG